MAQPLPLQPDCTWHALSVQLCGIPAPTDPVAQDTTLGSPSFMPSSQGFLTPLCYMSSCHRFQCHPARDAAPSRVQSPTTALLPSPRSSQQLPWSSHHRGRQHTVSNCLPPRQDVYMGSRRQVNMWTIASHGTLGPPCWAVRGRGYLHRAFLGSLSLLSTSLLCPHPRPSAGFSSSYNVKLA